MQNDSREEKEIKIDNRNREKILKKAEKTLPAIRSNPANSLLVPPMKKIGRNRGFADSLISPAQRTNPVFAFDCAFQKPNTTSPYVHT